MLMGIGRLMAVGLFSVFGIYGSEEMVGEGAEGFGFLVGAMAGVFATIMFEGLRTGRE